MIINQLIETTQKPEIYTPGTAVMWVDEYISTQLLEVHLNQDVDLASRKNTTISQTIEWILGKVPAKKLKILDLGCGPGLYTEKLAKKGHCVTGMDFSSNSIDHARKSAHAKQLNISYIQQNYLQLEAESQYDLILMIFTDFGVLSPDQRETLLANVYRALKPGGTFVFDVLNENYPVKESRPKEYDLSSKGFWRNIPYLAITESFYYEEQKVSLSQHVVIDDVRGVEIYRFWIHVFSHADLNLINSRAGFSSTECFNNVVPDSTMYDSASVTFCITTK